MSKRTQSWRSVLAVAAAAVVTVVVIDLLIQRVSKVIHRREVEEATAEYAASDPTVLVLGSSHARTFVTIDKVLRERTGGRERVLSVPVEWGKYRSYEWVLRNRIVPFIDEKDASGAPVRKSLRRFILLTAWWDACGVEGEPPVFNLPSRAWQLRHFLADLLENGLTPYNRNYVSMRWLRLFYDSILVWDRGHNRIPVDLRKRFRPLSPEAQAAQEEMRLESWKGITLTGRTCLLYAEEMAALDRILDWAKARGYETTLIAYPMIPKSVDERTRVVLDRFSAAMTEVAREHGIPFFDWTTSSPVTDDDFFSDYDHLNPEGDLKLSLWALDGDLKLLSSPSEDRL